MHPVPDNPFRSTSVLPEHLNISWKHLANLDGDKLENEYRRILTELDKEPTNLGVVFRKAQNRMQEPALLRKLIVDLIGSETWSVGGNVNGDAYEALLQRSATDVKFGAGQYFTPRPLIHAMVKAIRPTAGDTVVDPACGTGGFLLSAIEHIERDASEWNAADPAAAVEPQRGPLGARRRAGRRDRPARDHEHIPARGRSR
ncbi:MAG: HsdM family class I SAM-dependent methyltransferase [Pseudonocardia sp.]